MQEKACPSLNEIHSDVSGLIQTLREANLWSLFYRTVCCLQCFHVSSWYYLTTIWH